VQGKGFISCGQDKRVFLSLSQETENTRFQAIAR